MSRPRFTALLASLPSTVPFVAPDALERRSGQALVLRLGANESNFGTSPRVLAAMHAAVDKCAFYGDPESWELRARLALANDVSMAHLVVGSGIDDLLALAVRAFMEPGAPVVTSLGGYPTFAYHVAGHGGVLHRVPYRDDKSDLDGLAEAARRTSARIVYLANPDNPSGSWHSGDDVRALLDQLPPDCLLLLDEAYIEFAPAGTAPAIELDNSRVIRFRTFSKIYGMAGARIGYAIADETTIAAFEKIRLHFGVNSVAQAGALAALDDDAFRSRVIAAVDEGRKEYAALGARLEMPTLPSATNFVCFDVGGVERARALVSRLLENRVFIRMPSAPPLDRCVRVTVGDSRERAEFASIMLRLRDEDALRPISTSNPQLR